MHQRGLNIIHGLRSIDQTFSEDITILQLNAKTLDTRPKIFTPASRVVLYKQTVFKICVVMHRLTTFLEVALCGAEAPTSKCYIPSANQS